MSIIPPYLKFGDAIGITCPASKMDKASAEYAADVLKSWGYDTVLGDTVGTDFHNFSAPDEIRLSDLQKMLDDDHIKAILFGRGGYGMVRILDKIDFSHFVRHPKWVCGYSDITALLTHLYTCYDISSVHSLMSSGINPETKDDAYILNLKAVLSGHAINYDFLSDELNKPGTGKGELIGGNLSLLVNLSGTISQPEANGKILFIEDTGEYRYSVDRMMINLKRAGWLKDLNGLIVGSFTESKETETPFGQTEYELILDKVKEYKYPVAFGFPVGHQKENYPLKIGIAYTLSVGEKCSLSQI